MSAVLFVVVVAMVFRAVTGTYISAAPNGPHPGAWFVLCLGCAVWDYTTIRHRFSDPPKGRDEQ